MTALPRVDMGQHDLPGTDGSSSMLVLHDCTDLNYSQRITIAVRRPNPGRRGERYRHHDILLTKKQLLKLIDHLIDRVDLMRDDIPEGPAT